MLTITIPDLDAASLNAAVEFAYTGTVALDLDNKDAALPLIAGLQLLDMGDAIETVQTWVGDQLDPTSALRVQHTADRLHLGVLKARADEYIDKHFEAVTKTEEWQMLPAEAVGEVLARDELRPGREINVFHALVRWARAGGSGGGGAAAGGGGESKEGDQEEGREAQFVDLLGRCVRAARLSSNELSLVVLGELLVENSLAAYRMMTRVLRERTVDPSEKAQFASPEPLCRRRADGESKLYALGGNTESVECFDPLTGEWSPVADMGVSRMELGAGVLEGKMYAMGGDDGEGKSVECLDPVTGLWAAVAPMSTRRVGLGVATVDGKMYAVGGYDVGSVYGLGGGYLNSVECFDPSTAQWSAVAPMSTGRYHPGVAVVNGKLYAVGGRTDSNAAIRSVECFDPSTRQWSGVADMSIARRYHDVAVADGKLYAMGGEDATGSPLSSVECFDPSTEQWSPVAAMSTAQRNVGAAVAGGKLYAVGNSSVECFDPLTGQWSAVAAMNNPGRSYHAVVSMETLE
jgi:N-acetylneuraminic acid mutarotase